MAFCTNCGKQLENGSRFCAECGQAVNGQASASQQTTQGGQYTYQPPVYQQPPQTTYVGNNLISQLSNKVKTEAYVWIGVACFQVIIGLLNLTTGLALNSDYEDGTYNIVFGTVLLIVAGINFMVSSKDIKYSKDIFMNPVGIVAKYRPVSGLVGNLVYNLLFGGIIGVVGSIFGFVTRSFVMSNEQAFLSVEANFMNK